MIIIGGRSLLEQLDRIERLLACLVDQEPETGACRHERTRDLSTMGQRPGTRVQCDDCGELLIQGEPPAEE